MPKFQLVWCACETNETPECGPSNKKISMFHSIDPISRRIIINEEYKVTIIKHKIIEKSIQKDFLSINLN